MKLQVSFSPLQKFISKIFAPAFPLTCSSVCVQSSCRPTRVSDVAQRLQLRVHVDGPRTWSIEMHVVGLGLGLWLGLRDVGGCGRRSSTSTVVRPDRRGRIGLPPPAVAEGVAAANDSDIESYLLSVAFLDRTEDFTGGADGKWKVESGK